LNRHLSIVAAGFRFSGFVIGAPSVLSLIGAAAAAIFLQFRPAPDASKPLDIQTYGLVGLLSNGARAVNHGVNALLGAAEIVCLFVAAASLAVALFAVLLWFIGRGLGRRKLWARIGASLLCAVLTLMSAAALASVSRGGEPVAALALGVSLYALWAVLFRYA
jgi:hypothetical protein